MSRRRYFVAAAALALLLPVVSLTGASLATAATFTYSGYSVTNEQNISISAPNHISGGAGQITLIGSGANAGEDIFAYCMDIYTYLAGSGTYQIGPLTTAGTGSPNPTLTNTQIGQIGALIVNGSALINSSFDVSAAIQLAIWKVEYGVNNFIFSGLDIGAKNLADAYLADVAPGGIWAPDYNVFLLSGNGSQSLVFVDPTPLPSTWTMMLIGLAGLGFACRRMKKDAAAFAAA